MDEESATGPKAGLLRRLAALLYDLLLVIALAVIVTFAALPFTHGEAILASSQGALAHVYHAIILLVVFAYFGWCWTRSGQTLGMKAWRIRLEKTDGIRLDWAGAIVRFSLGAALSWMAALGAVYLLRPGGSLPALGAATMLAPLILNFAWVPFDRAGRSLQDVAGRSRVIRSG